jgi:hypothetical protein
MTSHTVAYFGEDTVSRAVAYYFMKHGITEEVRDKLMALESEDGDAFFQLVADYAENFSTVNNKD